VESLNCGTVEEIQAQEKAKGSKDKGLKSSVGGVCGIVRKQEESSLLRSSPDLTPAPACGRQALPGRAGLLSFFVKFFEMIILAFKLQIKEK